MAAYVSRDARVVAHVGVSGALHVVRDAQTTMSTLERSQTPTADDWQNWVERLAAGEEPATAARAEGQTCTSFRRNNPEAHAEALALSREARASQADLQGERWALDPDASDAMRLAWLKRWNTEWAGTQRLEVEHAGSVVVEHERRLTLGDVADLARQLQGHRPSTGGELPAASPVLPAPPPG